MNDSFNSLRRLGAIVFVLQLFGLSSRIAVAQDQTINGNLTVSGEIAQAGVRTKVLPTLVAPSNNTDSYRYEIGRMGVNQHHWGQYGVITIELTQTYFISGASQKWYVKAGYGDFSGSATLVERFGDSSQYARVTLGAPVLTGNSYSGYPNQYIPIYVDASYYTQWKVKITHSWSETTNDIPEYSQLRLFDSPAQSTLGNQQVAAGDVSSALTGTLSVHPSTAPTPFSYVQAGQGSYGLLEVGIPNSADNKSFLSLHRVGAVAYQLGISGNDLVLAQTGGTGKDYLDTQRLRVAANGNVGIGTTAPLAKLDTNGSAFVHGATAGVRLGGDDAGAYGWLSAYDQNIGTARPLYLQTSGANTVLNVFGGNVGIANSAPGTFLHVGSGSIYSWSGTFASGTPQLMITPPAGEASIGLNVADGSNRRRAKFFVDDTNALWGLASTYGNSPANFIITTGGNSEAFRITSAGNVGIGTTSPATKLDVAGDIKASSSVAAPYLLANYPYGDAFPIQAIGSGISKTANTYYGLLLGTGEGGASRLEGGIRIQGNPNGSLRGLMISAYENGYGPRDVFVPYGNFNIQSGNLAVSGSATFGGNLAVSGSFSAGNYQATSGTVTGGTSGLTLSAGGANQNVTIAPSGTGATIVQGDAQVTSGTLYASTIASGTSSPASERRFNGYVGGLVDGGSGTAQYYTIGTLDLTGVNYTSGVIEGLISVGRSYQNNPEYRFTFTYYRVTGSAVGNLSVEYSKPFGALKLFRNGDLFKLVAYNDHANQAGFYYDVVHHQGDNVVGSAWIQLAHNGTDAASSTAAPAGFIESTSSEFAFARNKDNGFVGIGTASPDKLLTVKGTVHATEVIVDTTVAAKDLKVQPTGWADYVFDESYRNAPLSEVEQQIKTNKHLPGVPSATDVAKNGVNLGQMQAVLLQKIEELTLHQIEQQKRLEAVETELTRVKAENAALRTKTL